MMQATKNQLRSMFNGNTPFIMALAFAAGGIAWQVTELKDQAKRHNELLIIALDRMARIEERQISATLERSHQDERIRRLERINNVGGGK